MPHVRVGGSSDVLRDIGDPAINLAIWRRSQLCDELREVDLDRIDPLAVERVVDVPDIELVADLNASGYPVAIARRLAHEIAMLASGFAAVAGTSRLSIRLDVIETDACRRFHVDYVTARLICTLIGPGTQWLDAADAAALGKGADVESLTIRSIATGDVALFKGRLWSPEAPIVHRSPPIAKTGDRRLLLVIDPAREDAPPHDRSE